MIRILIIALLIISVFSCGQQTKHSDEKKQDSTVIIFGIQSYIDEIHHDSLSKHIEEYFSNNKKSEYSYQGWKFKTYRVIYNNGKFVGVRLTNKISDSDTDAIQNDFNRLDSISSNEFGSVIDKHQPPTINIIKKYGEYPFMLWSKDNVSSLLSVDYDNECFSISIIVYQNNAIKIDSRKRRIDNDLEEINKLNR